MGNPLASEVGELSFASEAFVAEKPFPAPKHFSWYPVCYGWRVKFSCIYFLMGDRVDIKSRMGPILILRRIYHSTIALPIDSVSLIFPWLHYAKQVRRAKRNLLYCNRNIAFFAEPWKVSVLHQFSAKRFRKQFWRKCSGVLLSSLVAGCLCIKSSQSILHS